MQKKGGQIAFKALKPIAVGVAGKAIWDAGNAINIVGRKGFNAKDPVELSFVPVIGIMSGLLSVVSSAVVITGSPIGIPMYVHNHFNDKQNNENFHKFLKFPYNVFK